MDGVAAEPGDVCFDDLPEVGSLEIKTRRWLRRVGVENVADLFDLRIADALGNGKRAGFPAYLEPMRRRVTRQLEDAHALEVTDLAIDGHDVMRELGIPPGPRVREALESLLEQVLDRPETNQHEILLERLRQLRASNVTRS